MRSRIGNRIALALAAVLVAAAPGCSSDSRSPSSNPAPSPTAAPAPPSTGDDWTFPYQPLWPFATAEQARSWQETAASAGHQPWHLDAETTALGFTRDFLGFTEIDRVTSVEVVGDDAWVGVGYALPGSDRTATAAVLHLARFGRGEDAPWEVVGTRDASLVVDTPRYGAVVTSPFSVGGEVTGVDESLRVEVRQVGREGRLGHVCCVPAGGERQRWQTQVEFTGAERAAMTVVVSTGGHVADVERFAITAVRPG